MGKTGDDAPATLTRYSPGSSPRMPKKPLPSVVVVRAACDATDSIVTTAPSPASVYPITEPVFGGVLGGGAGGGRRPGRAGGAAGGKKRARPPPPPRSRAPPAAARRRSSS